MKKESKKTHPTSGLKKIFIGTLGRWKTFLLNTMRKEIWSIWFHTASSFLFLAAFSEDVFYLHIILADTSHNPCTALSTLEHSLAAENPSHFWARKAPSTTELMSLAASSEMFQVRLVRPRGVLRSALICLINSLPTGKFFVFNKFKLAELPSLEHPLWNLEDWMALWWTGECPGLVQEQQSGCLCLGHRENLGTASPSSHSFQWAAFLS